jgi:hypothetical protein
MWKDLQLPLHVRRRICLSEQRARCPKAIAEVSDGETTVIDLSPNPGTGGLIEGTPAAWFAEPLGGPSVSPGLEGHPTP